MDNGASQNVKQQANLTCFESFQWEDGVVCHVKHAEQDSAHVLCSLQVNVCFECLLLLSEECTTEYWSRLLIGSRLGGGWPFQIKHSGSTLNKTRDSTTLLQCFCLQHEAQCDLSRSETRYREDEEDVIHWYICHL